MVITFYQDSTKLYDDGMAAFSLTKSCYMGLLIRKNFSKPRWSSICVSLSILSRGSLTNPILITAFVNYMSRGLARDS